MENVRVAVKVLPDGKSVSIGHQFVLCHMVFDIKMEDFRGKARFVAGGQMIEAPATIIYTNVVSREMISLMILRLSWTTS